MCKNELRLPYVVGHWTGPLQTIFRTDCRRWRATTKRKWNNSFLRSHAHGVNFSTICGFYISFQQPSTAKTSFNHRWNNHSSHSRRCNFGSLIFNSFFSRSLVRCFFSLSTSQWPVSKSMAKCQQLHEMEGRVDTPAISITQINSKSHYEKCHSVCQRINCRRTIYSSVPRKSIDRGKHFVLNCSAVAVFPFVAFAAVGSRWTVSGNERTADLLCVSEWLCRCCAHQHRTTERQAAQRKINK